VYVDSLRKRLEVTGDDNQKLLVASDLAYSLKTINPAEGIRYGEMEKELALKLNNKAQLGQSYRNIGLNYQTMSDYPKALDNYYKALDIYESMHAAELSSEVIGSIAVIYAVQGNAQKALEYDLKCLHLDEKAGFKSHIAGDLGNLGNVYMSLSNYTEALKCDLRSLKIFEELGDKADVAANYGNIGNIYQKEKRYEEAQEYNNKALELCQSLGDKDGIATNLGNIGSVYIDAAKDPAQQQAGKWLLEDRKANLNKGIDYLTKAIAASGEINELENIIDFSHDLYEADSLAGNYKDALASYKRFAVTQDSVFSSSNKLKIANTEANGVLELKYKQAQIDALEAAKRKRDAILYTIGAVLIIAIIAGLIRKFNRQARANQLLATEKAAHLKHIKEQTDVLTDIAYKQSHEVRAPIATILGLVQLFNLDDATDPINKEIIAGVEEVTKSLDTVIQEVIRIENSFSSRTSEI
jgi:hypothetical protein